MTAPRSQENGVSEVLGSILLVAVVVGAVAMVGVALLSQPLPKSIPSLNAIITRDTTHPQVYIKHDGGDSFAYGDIKLYVNGADVTSQMTLNTSLNQPGKAWVAGTTWKVGTFLQYNTGSATVSSVQIVSTPGNVTSSAVVLTSVFY